MLDLLRSIPGPQFLVIFVIFFFTLFIVGKISLKDRSTQNSMPSMDALTPIEISYLKGGVKNVLNSVLFELYNNKLITSDVQQTNRSSNKPYYIKTDVTSHSLLDSPIHSMVCNAIDKPKRYKDLCYDNVLMSKIKAALLSTDDKLVNLNLLRSDDYIGKVKKIKFIILFPTYILGILKVGLGLISNKPVSFLISLLVLFTILTLIFFRTNKAGRLSAQGLLYLKRLGVYYQWIKNPGDERIDSFDPSLLMALYGFGSLYNTPFVSYYDDFYGDEIIRQNMTMNSGGYGYGWGGSSSGCGGSDSSSGCGGSSSDSSDSSSSGCGGSDSGSSGCGGGCGGCGGGGD